MRLVAPLVLLVLSALPLAQNARPSKVVDTSALVFNPAVKSVGTFSVIAYVDDATGQVFTSRSNNRGITWQAPVPVSSTVGLKTLESHSVHIVGAQVFVGWMCDDEVFFNRFDGAVWTGEQHVDKGVPQGTGATRDWRLDVSQGTGGVHVTFAQTVDADGLSNEGLFVTTSSNGGATFGAPVEVPTLGAGLVDVDALDLCLDGDLAYVVWTDDRSGLNDLYFQHSSDGGATWIMPVELRLNDLVPMPSTAEVQPSVALHARGGVVAAVWVEQRPDGTSDQLRGRVSLNGGSSFGPDLRIGNYTAGFDDVDFPVVRVTSGGAVAAMWEDNRTGGDEVYESRSTNGGFGWEADTRLSTAGGAFPRLVGGEGDRLVAAWTSGVFRNFVESAFSLDAGASYTVLTASTNIGDVDMVEVAYNAAEENVVGSWLSDDLGANDVYGGGYAICNPATVTLRSAPPNADSLTSTAAILGGTFTATVDLASTGHTLGVIFAYTGGATIVIDGGQFLLTNPMSAFLFQGSVTGPLGMLSQPVAFDPSLCHLPATIQAAHFGGAPGIVLSNAVDLVLGAF